MVFQECSRSVSRVFGEGILVRSPQGKKKEDDPKNEDHPKNEDYLNKDNLKNKDNDFLWHNLPFKGFSHYKVLYVALHRFSNLNCSNCIGHFAFIILNFYWKATVILMSRYLCL